MTDTKKPKRVRQPWPATPDAWKAEHDARTITAFARLWDRVPARRKRALRSYLIETLGQVDIEESATGKAG